MTTVTTTLVAYVRSQLEWVRVGGRYTSIEGAREKLRESIAITNYYARSPTHITWDIAVFDPSVFALASTCGVPVPAILRELPDGVAFYTDSWIAPDDELSDLRRRDAAIAQTADRFEEIERELSRLGRLELDNRVQRASLESANEHLRGLLEGAQTNLAATEAELEAARREVDRLVDVIRDARSQVIDWSNTTMFTLARANLAVTLDDAIDAARGARGQDKETPRSTYVPPKPSDYVCTNCGETMTTHEDFDEYQHSKCGGLVELAAREGGG